MSDKSGIAWCDATWNPTTGCTKVSSGCRFCYAKHQAWPRLAAMKTGVYSGRKFEDVQVHPERLEQPLRWRKPRMIFVDSMSDLFHESIPDYFIDLVFSVMAMASNHIFQVLTKRPERMRKYCSPGGRRIMVWDEADAIACDMNMSDSHPSSDYLCGGREAAPWPLPNVWLGTSVENQATADERIPLLMETPAAIRWISAEPLLGPIDLVKRDPPASPPLYGARWLPQMVSLDWVVVGGESGPKARPMSRLWCDSLRHQCRRARVPFFMKQGSQNNWPRYHDFESFPRSLQVREYPDCQERQP